MYFCSMLKERINSLYLFFKSSNFFRGLIVTIAILIPLTTLIPMGHSDYAISIAIGILLNAPSDIPGSLKRKINSILISIALTMVVTFIVAISHPYFWVLLAVIAVLSFGISLLSVYGFRGSLVSFSGLMAMVLGLTTKISDTPLWIHILCIAIGGLFYLCISLVSHWILPKKDEDQLLADTLDLTGDYLIARGKLITQKNAREENFKNVFQLQTQISEKHELLRELLLMARTKSGRTHFDEKRLLIFISLVDILELSLANNLEYNKIDTLFKDHSQHLQKFIDVNFVFGNHLKELAETILKKDKIHSKDSLLLVLDAANNAIAEYVAIVTLPKAREGAIILKNLYDYLELQLQKIRAIRRVLSNSELASRTTLKSSEAQQFITTQDYSSRIILENLSFNSPIFRHSLRFAVTATITYFFGTLLEIKNTYWIILTLLVIMRPNYGLTKGRSINRIAGTLIGAVIAAVIIFMTQSTAVYSILAAISLTFALSLTQQNYRWAAVFFTTTIIFSYSLLTPNAFEIIQYRVLDTAIGALLAVVANYLLWPSWEFMNLERFLVAAIRCNTDYLLSIKKFYRTKEVMDVSYKVTRKHAFLAISNLNAAFQRMTQDPASKRKAWEPVYEMVTLNNTILSTLASLGSFIQHHKTTEASDNFITVVDHIENTLLETLKLLDQKKEICPPQQEGLILAQEKLKNSYELLVEEREKELNLGHSPIREEMLLNLQEAHLIYNQLIWLKNLVENLKSTTQKYSSHVTE